MKKIISLIKRLFKEYPQKMTVIVLLTTASGILEGIGISLFVPLLQLIQSRQSNTGQGKLQALIQSIFSWFGVPFTLGTVLLFALLIFLIQYSIMIAQQYYFFKFAYRFQYDLREKLFGSLMASKWQLFLANKIGYLSNALISEPQRANDAVQVLNTIISSVIISSIYILLAFFISWQITLLILLVGISLSISMRRNLNKVHKIGQTITEANNMLQMESIESLSGAKLIKGSSLEENSLGRFKEILKSVENSLFLSAINFASIRIIYEFAMIGLLCLSIYISVQYFGITISKLAVFLFIFYRLSPRLTNLQNSLSLALANIPAMEEIDRLFEMTRSMKETDGNIDFHAISKEINLVDVNFSYQKKELILKNINLVIPKGKITAIVGKSGSGKSTIVDLIMGLITPSQGKIMVDVLPLNEYNIKSWRQKIGYVPQDTFLFHDTVLANISWAGDSNTTSEKVKKAARLANAHDFIEKLPDGYSTVIGDRGARLSGGQRQRIALARALIRNPDILILDEATSSLDSESEISIQEAIEYLSGEITIIMITHRLSTVQNADIIYVLDDGLIIEKGSWAELNSDKKGHFSKMKNMQLI